MSGFRAWEEGRGAVGALAAIFRLRASGEQPALFYPQNVKTKRALTLLTILGGSATAADLTPVEPVEVSRDGGLPKVVLVQTATGETLTLLPEHCFFPALPARNSPLKRRLPMN